MFRRILVVLSEGHVQHCVFNNCVFNTALRFAHANQARLYLVGWSEDQKLSKSNLRSLAEAAIALGVRVEVTLSQTREQALIEIAENWSADLIIIGQALQDCLIQSLPCTVLMVQQDSSPNELCGATGTIAITMHLKPQAPDLATRNRLEKLLELTPRS